MAGGNTIHVVVVGQTTRTLGIHVAAMVRHQWRVEWRDASTLFSAGRGSPNAIVIDQSSLPPGTDAFKLVARARKEMAAPVVMLASARSSDLVRSAQAAGCTCISAPCRASTLIAGVTTAIAMAGGTHWKNLSAHEAKRTH